MSDEYRYEPPVLLSPLSSPAPRAVEMEQLFPNIKFLPYKPAKREIRMANKYKMKAILYPRAIMEYETLDPLNDTKSTQILLRAFERSWLPALGEVTFTMLKFSSGLSFEEVLGLSLDAYVNRDEWILTRFGMDRWEGGRFYYTSATKLMPRKEAKDPKWMAEIYRG